MLGTVRVLCYYACCAIRRGAITRVPLYRVAQKISPSAYAKYTVNWVSSLAVESAELV